MTMGASGVRRASAISGALSFTGVCTSTVLSTEERTSRMNEDVAVSFVKNSMEGSTFYLPSSLLRLVPATTALMSVLRNAPSSRASMPAIVVPAGEQTMAQRSLGLLPDCFTSSTLPSMVPRASLRATSRVRPALTPPRVRPSMNSKTYAGALPERPVTASMRDSATRQVTPMLPKISSASLSVASETPSVARPTEPLPTVSGKFGMTRST